MVAPGGIGALLRTIREKADRTREQQGGLIERVQGRPFDEANLKRWETEKRFPVPHWHSTIATIYGITVEQVRAAIATSQRYRKAQSNKEDDVKRRDFGRLAVVAAGAGVLPGIAQAREGIDGALAGSAQGELEYLEAAFERHRGGYHGRSPDAVLAEMRQDLDLLGQALARPHPVRERADLTRTAAGIAGLVAIVQHDRGDQRDAHGWFSTAARAARESGDRRMTAWVLARQAMVPLNYGAPAAAAKIAAQARREAGRTPTAAGALAAAVTARSLAALGDKRGATAALEDVRSLAERLDGDATADTWLGYPEQKHHVHLSQAYTLLGNTTAAYQAQDRALALTGSPSVMTRALLAMDTAACLRADGDPSAAADMAAGVFGRLPGPYREGLIRTRATTLHRTLTGRPHDLLGQALA
ncbi:transcriptional regulator [Streptomyces sp. NBC_00424]|uniref:transcriptional regulator n=1 Tax=Streptomyces sp. NBC_00424 TaxID=2903648 RepID=UPI0022591AA7|nr:transcriptional regulator [Streptomyces sp. NBC_00424]MCX5078967.1 transcriptional regulator [Streptomyces sp. NBC_00424]